VALVSYRKAGLNRRKKADKTSWASLASHSPLQVGGNKGYLLPTLPTKRENVLFPFQAIFKQKSNISLVHNSKIRSDTADGDGRNFSFVNSVKYFGVFFDKRMTRKLHIETIEAKASRTFIRIYSLSISERLSANIKLTLHKDLIRYVMTYACPAWEFASEVHRLKLQRL
jgi:hypothetical protein